MAQKSPVQGLINYMSAILMPLAFIAIGSFALTCGALIYTSFGGDGWGVARLGGAISGLAIVALILAAYLYRPKPYRKAVAEGHAHPVKLF